MRGIGRVHFYFIFRVIGNFEEIGVDKKIDSFDRLWKGL